MLKWFSSPRRALIVAHDLLMTAVAVVASCYVRFEVVGVEERLDTLYSFLPAFVVYAGFIYFLFHLYQAKWRFASLPDLMNIVRASSVLAVSLLVIDYFLVAPNVFGQYFFGKITISLYWILQIVLLSGSRIAYRYFRYTRTRHHARSLEANPTLILGRAADAEVLLRGIESGAFTNVWPVGILSSSPADRGQSIRGIPVRGDFEMLDNVVNDLAQRGTTVTRVIFTPSALDPEAKPEASLMRARRLGLTVSRLPSLDDGGELPRLAPVNVEDLLLHAVLETLATKRAQPMIDGRIADVRDRARLFRLMREFEPDIVFHAAALKHVPLLEANWEEGVKTNVFGSVNVADAAAAAGASAMVMISTDKAIEPVSVLGATKRFAEMYCQALDADLSRRAQAGHTPMRLIAVRFGNVLASNGSVVPKFKAQIEGGGPVTVTHPDMVRYFMTIREACDLVVTAATHALGPMRSDVSVYVLNMGQPVKIVDLAERMIRLAGLVPGTDIKIAFTGTRPGERMHEVLFARGEPTVDIGFEGVVAARPAQPSLEVMRGWLALLDQGLAREEREAIYRVLRDAVPDFQGAAA
jgi:FlaA1/EpsC-like NDP-sugar epimerase